MSLRSASHFKPHLNLQALRTLLKCCEGKWTGGREAKITRLQGECHSLSLRRSGQSLGEDQAV